MIAEFLVKRNDKRFPTSLRDANDYLNKSEQIQEIYYRGEFEEQIFDKCLAVVGSRRATTYGERICRKLVYELAASGITIVSGFMYGIDSFAHQAVLDAGGKTIAVLGYGIKRTPSNFQRGLYERILGNGLIISEYGDDQPAQKWTFPKRNRIVAGLSKAVLVIEASKNSGSLITANYSFQMNRKVFAVPGPLSSKNSIGTAKLIQGRGEVVTSSQDILQFFEENLNLSSRDGKDKSNTKLGGVTSLINKKELKIQSETEKVVKQIKNQLEIEPQTINELSDKISTDLGKLSINLTMMQLSGEIIEKDGRFYAR